MNFNNGLLRYRPTPALRYRISLLGLYSISACVPLDNDYVIGLFLSYLDSRFASVDDLMMEKRMVLFLHYVNPFFLLLLSSFVTQMITYAFDESSNCGHAVVFFTIVRHKLSAESAK